MIHVMAATGLGGAAMAAPVMGYDAIAVLEEEQHLRVPIIGRQRPAVAEHDGLTFAPVLVEDLNAVFGGDRSHAGLLWRCVGARIEETFDERERRVRDLSSAAVIDERMPAVGHFDDLG